MHSLIQRYVAEVVKRLPEKERKDIQWELESSILDMLGEEYTDEDVKETLNKLGSPSKLSDQYRSRPRYLISPTNFDLYLFVLKLVAIVVGSVITMLKLLTLFFSSEPIALIPIIGSVLAALLSSLSSAFVWVTLTFAILDYFHVKTDSQNWTVKDLPEESEYEGLVIKRTENIIDVTGTIIFIILLALLYRKPEVLAVYLKGREAVPVFITSYFKPFILALVGVNVVSLLVSIAKLYSGKWNHVILGSSIVSDMASALFFVFFITRWHLINPDFLLFFKNGLHTWQGIAKAASVCFVLLTLFSVGEDSYRVLKHTRSSKLPNVAEHS